MRRKASEWAVGHAATKAMTFRVPRALDGLKATAASARWASRGLHPAGSSTTARTKRTTQKPGRPSFLLVKRAAHGEPTTLLRRAACPRIAHAAGRPRRHSGGEGKTPDPTALLDSPKAREDCSQCLETWDCLVPSAAPYSSSFPNSTARCSLVRIHSLTDFDGAWRVLFRHSDGIQTVVPYFANGMAVFVDSNNHLCSYGLADGALQWKLPWSHNRADSLPVARSDSGLLLTGSSFGRLAIVRPNGSVLEAATVAKRIGGTAAWLANDIVAYLTTSELVAARVTTAI